MVRALLAGTKTQTRRIVKPQPFWQNLGDGQPNPMPKCKYGEPGDRLWVKETYAAFEAYPGDMPGTVEPEFLRGVPKKVTRNIAYRADDGWDDYGPWLPSIFMSRWASRITVEIVSVRIERLLVITEEDAVAEGVSPVVHEGGWSAWDPETQGYPEFFVEPSADYVKKRGLENLRRHRPSVLATARDSYRNLWIELNGLASWDLNPWVWVIAFKPPVVKPVSMGLLR
jgi:hypothetical protein